MIDTEHFHLEFRDDSEPAEVESRTQAQSDDAATEDSVAPERPAHSRETKGYGLRTQRKARKSWEQKDD